MVYDCADHAPIVITSIKLNPHQLCPLLIDSTELGIGLEAAVDLLRLVRDSRHVPVTSSQCTTAWDLINDSQLQQPIVTFSERLDELFGGGIPIGKLTEFCGAPGIGKTQLWCV